MVYKTITLPVELQEHFVIISLDNLVDPSYHEEVYHLTRGPFSDDSKGSESGGWSLSDYTV